MPSTSTTSVPRVLRYKHLSLEMVGSRTVRAGVTLEVQGDDIVCTGTDDVLTPDVVETLRARRTEVLDELRRNPQVWRSRQRSAFASS